MTEDEAKTKWCPFVRFAIPTQSGAVSGYNRTTGNMTDGWNACIGSKCMAWVTWRNAADESKGVQGECLMMRDPVA